MAIKYYAISIGLFGLLNCAAVQASCGSTFCTINSNLNEHGLSQPGWNTDLRYSYSQADILRSGSKKIAADTTGDEVENLQTSNKLITASADYTHDDHWGLTLQIPYVTRTHEHNVGPYDVNNAPRGYEKFQASAWGDAKVLARYRWPLAEKSHSEMGMKFGLKLPTGKKDFEWETGDIPSEVTLQPGNGSTDVILGIFWHQATPGSDWDWFAQGSLQDSIKSSATFTPGNQINLDGGTRYAFNHKLSGLLQLNIQWNDKDAGTAAALTPTQEASSGGRSVALTPGLSYALTADTQLFGLLQLPLYQYVNGEQLTAQSTFSLGINHRF